LRILVGGFNLGIARKHEHPGGEIMLKEKTPVATEAGENVYISDSTTDKSSGQAFNPELSIYFGGIGDVQKGHIISLKKLIDKTMNCPEWLAGIELVRRAIVEHGKKSPQHEAAKLALPYFVASGTYQGRNNAGLIQPSGLVQCDVDNLSKFDLIRARLMLENDVHCVFGFTSPSGNGFKMLCRANFSNNLEYRAAWKALSEHYENHCGIEVDAKAKAMSQPCFVSSDVRAIVNLAATPIEYALEEPPTIKPLNPESGIIPQNRAESYCKSAIEGAARDIHNAPKSTGNSILFTKSLRMGQLAHTGGISEEKAKQILVDAYMNRGGHSLYEAEQTFLSGWRKGIAEPRELENREVQR
jgi:hypothetical protein